MQRRKHLLSSFPLTAPSPPSRCYPFRIVVSPFESLDELSSCMLLFSHMPRLYEHALMGDIPHCCWCPCGKVRHAFSGCRLFLYKRLLQCSVAVTFVASNAPSPITNWDETLPYISFLACGLFSAICVVYYVFSLALVVEMYTAVGVP